jgi:hypothetical protein
MKHGISITGFRCRRESNSKQKAQDLQRYFDLRLFTKMGCQNSTISAKKMQLTGQQERLMLKPKTSAVL